MTSDAAKITPSRSAELIARGDLHNSPTYAPSLVIDRGNGVTLWDVDGNEYLDFVAGIAVCSLGYSHPRLVEALTEQIERVIHVSNMFYSEPQIQLMERLTESSFADRVFLCNSGTEATEGAMKLARRYQRVVRGDEKRDRFVSMKKSFHGRTLASITATGQPKYHKGFEPLPPGFGYAEFNDLDSVAELVDDRTTAVILEPVQGEGGVRPATPAFLQGVRELCDEHGALLIYDEVQTGVGRTGDLFAYQGYDVPPDIICLAKGLGGGVPVGAMMARDEVFQGFERGSHATTFGGNPLACTAANTVLQVIEDDALCDNARERGAELVEGLREIGRRYEMIVDVRGRGLMVGVECAGDGAKRIAAACRTEGLLVNTAGGTTVRFVPPLVIDSGHVQDAVRRFARAVDTAVS
jgi:predicted acetylornithine/succinylornithine family transaminase